MINGADVHAPRHRGCTVFFTGFSGAGKSTLARLLQAQLQVHGRDDVVLLDGDDVRKRLSSDLGFSREDRNRHLLRIGAKAREVTQGGGIAICAVIAPYDEGRRQVRSMVDEVGGFVLVHVATSLDVCEQRDPKGLYARARAGVIQHFTGVSDPYEAPSDPEIAVDTASVSPAEATERIRRFLECSGYLAGRR